MDNKTVNLQFSLDSDNFRLLENDGYCDDQMYINPGNPYM